MSDFRHQGTYLPHYQLVPTIGPGMSLTASYGRVAIAILTFSCGTIGDARLYND
jgi:hypothetical protein